MGMLKSCQSLRRRRKVAFCVVIVLSAFGALLGVRTFTGDRYHGIIGDGEELHSRVAPSTWHRPSIKQQTKTIHMTTKRADIINREDRLEHPGTTGSTLNPLPLENLHPDGEISVSDGATKDEGRRRAVFNNSELELRTNNYNIKLKNKLLILLGHYEQLGMSTVNFFNAVYLSHTISRKIVLPLVRHSRFCGLPVGWSGSPRQNTRRFIPMSTYYNVTDLANILQRQGTQGFVELDDFLRSCSKSSGRKITMLYFLYKDDRMTYLHLDDRKLMELREDAKAKGWVKCDFLDQLKSQDRFEADVIIDKHICLDPEIITNTSTLGDILGEDECVSVLFWRGIGDKRTHFNVSSFMPPKSLLPLVKPSNTVLDEINRFSKRFRLDEKKYIGVHIRSERQILWLGLPRLKKCLHLLTKVVKDLRKEKNIYKVLVSSDAGKYGSDQLYPYLNTSESKEVILSINDFIKSVNGLTYKVRKLRDPLWTDTGLVALVELHLLARSDQLVTLGAGTFQNWLVDVFRAHKSERKENTWSISRACLKETKKTAKEKGNPKTVPTW